MPYHPDAENIRLGDLLERIRKTDLVPSRGALLDAIDAKFQTLRRLGCSTLADLRKKLKNAGAIASLSEKTGIDSGYLTLLRREIEGYFPKAFPVNAFDWLPKADMAKLEKHGLKNSALLYEALHSPKKRSMLRASLGIDAQRIDALYSLADLTRIQWVSPTAARMLVAAGYDTAKKVAKANPGELCDALDRVNKEHAYFKGKIGLRDVKRLVMAATYVS